MPLAAKVHESMAAKHASPDKDNGRSAVSVAIHVKPLRVEVSSWVSLPHCGRCTVADCTHQQFMSASQSEREDQGLLTARTSPRKRNSIMANDIAAANLMRPHRRL